MRTDLTEMEHKMLYDISNDTGYCWINRYEHPKANASMASLIERGLVRKEKSFFVKITEDGALLARLYGKP
jgi:Mn-dependent DtxR family transcriptional regulator